MPFLFIFVCIFNLIISNVQIYLDDPGSMERYFHFAVMYASMYTAFILMTLYEK